MIPDEANFIAEGSAETDLETYNRNYPFRIAHKHAHSQQNPEADWGKNVLEAIEFAYYILNLEENFGEVSGEGSLKTITPENTIVIAAGISNGGGSALLAAERDSQGLIDAVVASEPNINPRKLPDAEGFSIVRGGKIYPHSVYGKTLFDSATFCNIYQPCASAGTMLALGVDPAKGTPEKNSFPAGMPGRCAALRWAGLLASDTLAEQIAESQKLLNDYGILESANTMAHIYNAFFAYGAMAVLYGNSYGRFSVADNLCGYSYACSVDNNPPSPKSKANLASDFFLNSGIPPSNGTNIINNKGNNGGGINFRYSVDENNNFDEYLEGALCLRKLATGTTGVTLDFGVPLSGKELDNFHRVRVGIEEILASGNLQGKPAIIVHGRDDALIHVNFHSRSYYGLNQKVEGDKSNLVYVEVKNAHHLDSVNQAFDMDSKIPLFYYFQQALDLVYDRLKNGASLPKSQVVSTVPLEITGGDKLTPEKNLPDLKSEVVNEITFTDDVLNIPEC